MEHSVVQPGEIHSPFQWVVTDAAARAAITPEGATDVHKVCLQLDTGAEWRLSGIGPNTWVEIVARAAPHEHDEAYAPLTHAGAGGTAHANAVAAGAAGFMTGADKTKLDGIATGAQVNVATNIAQGTRTTTTVPITSSTGTGATLGAATTSLAGVMSSADKTKLDGVATSANNYTHPANHAPSIITQDTNNRFVTDAEKATWNGKATPSDITTAINNLVDASPGTLDTLNELAAALGDDPNFATTMTNALAAKAPLASPTFTGTVDGITATMVGLGNVDNTSDANKPVSTAQATANGAVQTAAATDASTKANAVLAELNSKLWIGI